MSNETLAEREAKLTKLREEAARLQAEIDAEAFGRAAGEWARRGYYLTYYATTGFFLGMVAALVSLMFNIIGASIAGKDPLQLIRVYLTFGLGGREEAEHGLHRRREGVERPPAGGDVPRPRLELRLVAPPLGHRLAEEGGPVPDRRRRSSRAGGRPYPRGRRSRCPSCLAV